MARKPPKSGQKLLKSPISAKIRDIPGIYAQNAGFYASDRRSSCRMPLFRLPRGRCTACAASGHPRCSPVDVHNPRKGPYHAQRRPASGHLPRSVRGRRRSALPHPRRPRRRNLDGMLGLLRRGRHPVQSCRAAGPECCPEAADMSAPCRLCGVRPDVACRHRPADERYSPPVQDHTDRDAYLRSLQTRGNLHRRSVRTDGGRRTVSGRI